jgi:hypothetical protein
MPTTRVNEQYTEWFEEEKLVQKRCIAPLMRVNQAETAKKKVKCLLAPALTRLRPENGEPPCWKVIGLSPMIWGYFVCSHFATGYETKQNGSFISSTFYGNLISAEIQ